MTDFSKRIFYRVPGMSETRVHRCVYRDDDAKLAMDVYSSTSGPTSGDSVNKPVVFFVHGGPIPAEMTPPTEWGIFESYGEVVAASGFVGVVFNHRLHAPTDYQRSQADVLSAIDYIRSHAQSLRVDVNRMAIWIFSGGGAHFSWVLQEPPVGLRCALGFYPVLSIRPFLPPNADGTMLTFAERWSAVSQLKGQAADLPLFIARAGLDMPQINAGIDDFAAQSLALNMTTDILNHPQGRHGFDYLDDTLRTREIVMAAMGFLQAHLT